MLISQPFPDQLKELEKELEAQKSAVLSHPPLNISQFHSIPPTTNPKPKRRWLKRIIIAFGSIILIVALLIGIILSGLHFVVLNYFVSDIPPIDDSDLQLKIVNIPQEENAFYDFQEISKYLEDYPQQSLTKLMDNVEGKIWDQKFVDEALSQNEQVLAIFDQAYKKSRFQDPLVSDPAKILGAYQDLSIKFKVRSVLNVTRLSSLKALNLSHQGKDLEGLSEAVKAVEIGQKIQDSQSGLIDYLTGIAMKGYGLRTMQKIIATASLPPEVLIQDTQYLEKFKSNEKGLKIAFKLEYALAVNTIDELKNGITDDLIKKYGGKYNPNLIRNSSQKNMFVWQPNKTRALFANEIRAGIDEVGKPCSQTKDLKIKMLSPPLTSSSTVAGTFKLMVTENAIGTIIHDALMSSVDFKAQVDKKCYEQFLVSTTQLFFALKAYNLDTGGYPATLDELVPKYIPRVYEDPFDGKPIKYSPAKKIIYSVGKDRVDSGGSEGDEWLTMPDPTFKIEF